MAQLPVLGVTNVGGRPFRDLYAVTAAAVTEGGLVPVRLHDSSLRDSENGGPLLTSERQMPLVPILSVTHVRTSLVLAGLNAVAPVGAVAGLVPWTVLAAHHRPFMLT